MSHKYDPDEGVIIKIATHDEMQEVLERLARIEDKVTVNCNRTLIDMKKKAYKEGWDACNSEAVKFCKYMTEVLASKSPNEIEFFFDVNDVFDIYRKLEATGVIKWDKDRYIYDSSRKD